MSTILKTKQLTKDYGEGKGLFNLDLELKSAEIVGLLGPNGAGKTTLIKMLTKHIKPTSGDVEFLNNQYNGDVAELENFINLGFMPSEGGLSLELNAESTYNYFQKFFEADLKERFFSLCKILKIDTKTQIKKLSFGNRKKVAFLFAMLHSPKLVILDEPTAGLDPFMQKTVLNLLEEESNKGACVFLSSHTLSEVQSICDRLYILKEGKLVFKGTTIDATKQTLKEIIVLNYKKDLIAKVKAVKEVESVSEIGNDLLIYTNNANKIVKEFLIPLNLEFYIERPTLEKTFSKFYE